MKGTFMDGSTPKTIEIVCKFCDKEAFKESDNAGCNCKCAKEYFNEHNTYLLIYKISDEEH